MMMSENGVDTIVSEDNTSIVMEHDVPTVADYFGQLTGHWNDSVHSIIQMGIVLKRASKDLTGYNDDKDWDSLQSQLASTGIATKSQQQYLMKLSNSSLLINHFKSCVSSGNKVALPPDWKTLYQITTLSEADFSIGTNNNIINAVTTVGDVSKLKAGTHKKLPNYKTPEKTEGMKGKVVAQVAVDFSSMESEKQAVDLEQQINEAISNVVDNFSFANYKMSTPILQLWKTEADKRSKGKKTTEEKAMKKTESFLKSMELFDPNARQAVDKAYGQQVTKLFRKSA